MRTLGIVDWTNTDKTGQPIAAVLPLSDTSTPEWRAINVAEEFPTRGLAFWFRADGIKNDELVFFTPEENSQGREEFKDLFRVSEHHVAIEVRDFRELGSPEVLRAALEKGLKWPGLLPGRALLWCAGGLIVGPVKLITGGTNLITIDHSAQTHEIPCYSRDEIDIREVISEPFKRFVLAEKSPFVATSYVDWDSDKLVARRAIKWAATQANVRENGIDLTRQQIEQASDYLAESAATPKLKLEEYRLQRTLGMFVNVRHAEELAAAAVEELQSQPDIAQALEQLRVQVRKATAEEIRETLRVEKEALETAQRERGIIEAAIRESQTQLEQLRSEGASAVEEVDAEVRKRIAEVLEKPARLLADVAVLRTVLRNSSDSSPFKDSVSTTIRDGVNWAIGADVITDFTILRKALVRGSKAAGVPGDVAYRIHAAFDAKLIPILAGPAAMKALLAYSRVVCGGRVFTVHTSPNFFEPSDIFGKIDFVRRRFLPHSAGLIDIVDRARKTNGLALIVLEGANRAPTESYLLPLLHSVQNDGKLRLFHPSTIASDDPYRDVAEIVWPANLLLSATVVEGATTLPLSAEVWSSAALIETDSDVAVTPGFAEISEIDPDNKLADLPKELTGVPDSLLESLLEYAPFRDVSERFLRSLSWFQPDSKKLECALVESLLLPILVSLDPDEGNGEPLTRLIKATVNIKESSELEFLIRRIRRRLA